MELPVFKYHPNPLKTGSIIQSGEICEACEKATGYIYTGPVYAEDELDDCICPWCIASGLAHEKFDAEFTDIDGIGDRGTWDFVAQIEKEVVAFKTPGFCGWQQERWWTHCGQPAAFIGPVGNSDISDYGHDFIDSLQKESGMSGEQWSFYQESLSKDHSPTAYAFKCTKCGVFGGYSDCD